MDNALSKVDSALDKIDSALKITLNRCHLLEGFYDSALSKLDSALS